MKLTRPSIVCFSNLDWDYLRYRKQHLMSRLASRFDVVYVNPPRAMKARTPARWNTVQQVAEHLWVLEPIVLPGARTSPAIKRLTDTLIARAIARIPRSPGSPIAWAYSPHALGLVDLVAPRFVVYDIADNYTTPSGAQLRDERELDELTRLLSLEQSMLRRADLVLCVSDVLASRARQSHHDVHVVPNGCDYAAHQGPPSAGRTSLRPRIGYVGTIAPRVDVELLTRIAETHPEWDVDVIGPVSPQVTIDMARTPSNLHWKGAVPYGEIPAIIAGFDVGVLPLREIPFSTDCSPIQVFDYLAAGKPVVSTPVSQLERWPSVVRTARGLEQFGAAIEQALGDRSSARAAERRAFASANSWDARVDQIVGLLLRSGALPADQAAA